MSRMINPVRRPVRRQQAEFYLFITLLSFAVSVAVTRLFLYLADYPQLGGGGLHIAHVLWGGLLLFIAALLPLIFANRWVYLWGAVLAGIGVGLFIDEVGKFITQNNDYFYPAAAPIIYAFFLMTVLLYLGIRKPGMQDARTELYSIFESLEEVLDHDLDIHERILLAKRLRAIRDEPDHPDQSQLASALLDYLNSESLHLAPPLPGFWLRLLSKARALEARYINPLRMRAIIIGGLGGLGLVSLIRTTQMMTTPPTLEIPVSNPAATYWFLARLGLDSFVSLLLLVAAGLMIWGHIPRGLSLSYYGLLLSLTTVNLLVFYFHQFSTIIPATIQFALLLSVMYYKQKYIRETEQSSYPPRKPG